MTTPTIPWTDGLDPRQQQELDFARTYATKYAHGTDGHSRLMLIARLAELLDAATAPASVITSADLIREAAERAVAAWAEYEEKTPFEAEMSTLARALRIGAPAPESTTSES